MWNSRDHKAVKREDITRTLYSVTAREYDSLVTARNENAKKRTETRKPLIIQLPRRLQFD